MVRNVVAGAISLLTLAFPIMLPQYANAETKTWLPSSGNWNVDSNWSGGTVPSSSYDAVVDSGRTILVPVSGAARFLYVGNSGTGTLNVNGGTVTTTVGYLGYNARSNGTANVTSGTWNNSGSLYVGVYGTGTLNIDGGYVTDGEGYLGSNFGGGHEGTATVTSGTWNNSGSLYVGYTGTGALNINGGTVIDSSGEIRKGTATVTSGTWNNSGSLYVGYLNSTGTLNINGGTVNNITSYVGYSQGSNGSATVTGGTWNNSGTLYVGCYSGTGALNVNGGTVTNVNGSLGNYPGSNGSATVTSGMWNNSGYLRVGDSGTGTLNINGGTVTNSTGFIGYYLVASGTALPPGTYFGNGTATVTSGTWANANSLYVGYSGTGTLNLSGGGVVSVSSGTGTLTIASQAGSTGTLNLGDGVTVGTLNTTSVAGGSGTATVNFNHTGGYTFIPSLTGILSVNKLGSGTTILSGSNTYTGLTTISAGELDVNGSLGAASAVTAAIGATLGGSGTVNGTVAVNGTLKGTLTTGTVSGSGLISPGNSPGMLQVASIDASRGLSFAFEFTLANTTPVSLSAQASGNDILFLTSKSTPFMGNLTSDNTISIYLNRATVGDSFLGGFATSLSAVDLEAAIKGAKFAYFVEDDLNGTITLNGVKYSSLNGALFSIGAMNVSTSSFNGSEMQVIVVPEPSTWAMLVAGLGLFTSIQSMRRAKAKSV